MHIEGSDGNAVFMNFWHYLGLQAPLQEKGDHLGSWHDWPPEDLYIDYVCERAAIKGTGRSCPVGWSLFDGSCYKRIQEQVSYPVASSNCRVRGSHLVTISSLAENAHVQRLCGHQACWIGLSATPGSGARDWHWDEGVVEFELLSAGSPGAWEGFVNWDANQPERFVHRTLPWGVGDAAFMNSWEVLGQPIPWNTGISRKGHPVVGGIVAFITILVVLIAIFRPRVCETMTDDESPEASLMDDLGEQAREVDLTRAEAARKVDSSDEAETQIE